MSAYLERGRKRYFFLLLSFISSFLFYWFYFHEELVIVGYAGFVLFLLLKREYRLALHTIAGLGIWSISIYLAFSHPVGLGLFYRFYFYILGKNPIEESLPIPDVLKTIQEAQPLPFLKSYGLAFSSQVPFYLSLIGILLLFWYLRLSFLLLLPFFVFMFVVLFKGNIRLYMYALPLMALGFFFFIDYTAQLSKRLITSKALSLVPGFYFFCMSLLSFPVYQIVNQQPMFTEMPAVYKEFAKLSKILPQNAVIVSWWDMGYALQYYAKRATYHDGGSQAGLKTALIAKLLMSPNERLSRDIACILNDPVLTQRLRSALIKGSSVEKEATKLGEGCKFKQPHYLVINYQMLDVYGAIFYMAGYKKNDLIKLPLCEVNKDCIYELKDDGIYINTLKDPTTEYIYELVRYIEARPDGKVIKDISFNRSKGFVLSAVEKDGKLYRTAMKKEMFDRTMINLYFFPRTTEYFKLVHANLPWLVIYRID